MRELTKTLRSQVFTRAGQYSETNTCSKETFVYPDSDELLATVTEKRFIGDLVLQYLQRNGFDEVHRDLLQVLKPDSTGNLDV